MEAQKIIITGGATRIGAAIAEGLTNNKNQITINFMATTDKTTIINLTNHNYWNFNGHNQYYNNITNHIISIKADKYCEVNKELLPTGKILEVNGTKFDFNKLKKLILKC